MKSKLSNQKPSKRQAEILKFIIEFQKDNDYSPSLAEIAEYFEISIPTVHQHINYLRRKNLLDSPKNKKRSIIVHTSNSVINSTKNIKFDSFAIPVMGLANAGPAALFAEENIEGYVKISQRILQKKEGVFALRAEGDSMNQANINGKNIEEGDFILIDSKNKNPKNGEYVLSILDGCANLKKFEVNRKTGEMRLVSESNNKIHKPIFLSKNDDFMVNGTIIEVIKL